MRFLIMKIVQLFSLPVKKLHKNYFYRKNCIVRFLAVKICITHFLNVKNLHGAFFTGKKSHSAFSAKCLYNCSKCCFLFVFIFNCFFILIYVIDKKLRLRKFCTPFLLCRLKFYHSNFSSVFFTHIFYFAG
jgi:hypothetical protein